MGVNREQAEDQNECTHQCVWDGFTNIKDYKATVRVWIVFYVEEQWSEARDSLS